MNKKTLKDWKNATPRPIFGKKHFKLYHKKIRKTKSTDFWVEYKNVKNSEDRHLKKLLRWIKP